MGVAEQVWCVTGKKAVVTHRGRPSVAWPAEVTIPVAHAVAVTCPCRPIQAGLLFPLSVLTNFYSFRVAMLSLRVCICNHGNCQRSQGPEPLTPASMLAFFKVGSASLSHAPCRCQGFMDTGLSKNFNCLYVCLNGGRESLLLGVQ